MFSTKRDVIASFLVLFSIRENSYGMTQPRLGNTIIINIVSDLFPGSRLDAAPLENVYEMVGFDVFVCNDFSPKVIFFLSFSAFKNVPQEMTRHFSVRFNELIRF